MDSRSRRTVSPNMVNPAKKGMTRRAVTGIVLALLLPPVGIYYLWRNGIFAVRGRMLVTALSGLVFFAVCGMFMPKAAQGVLLPDLSVPAPVTPAPQQDWYDALSGVEEVILAEYIARITPAPTEDPLIVAQREAEAKEKEERVMNTIVYSVYNGAKYYHKQQKCGNQMNNKQLTVREALNSGLGACSLCNPPTP